MTREHFIVFLTTITIIFITTSGYFIGTEILLNRANNKLDHIECVLDGNSAVQATKINGKMVVKCQK